MKAVVSLALAGVLFGASTATAGDGPRRGGIQGLGGNLFRIEKNRQSAGRADQVTAKVGDRIEIDYTYPISPPFPSGVDAKSDNPAVKFNEVLGIVPQRIGIGILGAFFTASQSGTANLTVTIRYPGGGDVVLNVKVTVTQ